MLDWAELGNSAYLSISLRITGSWENERENKREGERGKLQQETDRLTFCLLFNFNVSIGWKEKTAFDRWTSNSYQQKKAHSSFVAKRQTFVIKSSRCSTWGYFINIHFLFPRRTNVLSFSSGSLTHCYFYLWHFHWYDVITWVNSVSITDHIWFHPSAVQTAHDRCYFQRSAII